MLDLDHKAPCTDLSNLPPGFRWKDWLGSVARWIPAGIWMCVIFTASTEVMSHHQTSRFFEPFFRWLIPGIPQENLDTLHLLFRKCGHLTEYAILAGLFWWGLGARGFGIRLDPRRSAFALLLATLYAATDEFHQSFIPSRGAAVTDVMIDTIGAALGLATIAVFLAVVRRRRARA